MLSRLAKSGVPFDWISARLAEFGGPLDSNSALFADVGKLLYSISALLAEFGLLLNLVSACVGRQFVLFILLVFVGSPAFILTTASFYILPMARRVPLLGSNPPSSK